MGWLGAPSLNSEHLWVHRGLRPPRIWSYVCQRSGGRWGDRKTEMGEKTHKRPKNIFEPEDCPLLSKDSKDFTGISILSAHCRVCQPPTPKLCPQKPRLLWVAPPRPPAAHPQSWGRVPSFQEPSSDPPKWGPFPRSIPEPFFNLHISAKSTRLCGIGWEPRWD